MIKVVFPMSSSKKKKKYLSKEFFRKISSNNFLVTSNKLRFYSNTERKRQYTGWVERFVILRLIQGNYRIYKEYTNPKDP